MRIRVREWQGVEGEMIGPGFDLNGAVYGVDTLAQRTHGRGPLGLPALFIYLSFKSSCQSH